LLVGLQLIPVGLLVIWPPPVSLTVSVRMSGAKVAVTFVSTLMVKLQVLVPLQPAPLQPVKAACGAGVAISVICVALGNCAEQVAPQLIPVGVLVTVPVAVPDTVTFNVRTGIGLKVALTVVSADIVT